MAGPKIRGNFHRYQAVESQQRHQFAGTYTHAHTWVQSSSIPLTLKAILVFVLNDRSIEWGCIDVHAFSPLLFYSLRFGADRTTNSIQLSRKKRNASTCIVCFSAVLAIHCLCWHRFPCPATRPVKWSTSIWSWTIRATRMCRHSPYKYYGYVRVCAFALFMVRIMIGDGLIEI